MKKNNLTKNKIISFLKKEKDVLDKFEVKRIGLFGSYARGEQKKGSDIDFVVDFKNPTFDNFMSLNSFLENSFRKKIDILTPTGIKSIRIRKIANSIETGVIYV